MYDHCGTVLGNKCMSILRVFERAIPSDSYATDTQECTCTCSPLRYINRREELVWNFLSDDHLYRSVPDRVCELHRIWGFICQCPRCQCHFDDSRIFKCVQCGKSSVYVSYAIEYGIAPFSDLAITTHFHDCFECGYALKSHEIAYYQSMERRIDDIVTKMRLDSESDLSSEPPSEWEWESAVEHIEQYLSGGHCKWFELWQGILMCFGDCSDGTVCGKSKVWVLKRCLRAMDRIYSEMNAYRWSMEWMLLLLLVDNEDESAQRSKSDRRWITRLWGSVRRAKGMFNPVDDDHWQSIENYIDSLKMTAK